MFLQKDNYLGEFSNEATSEDGGTIDEKALARLNLEVYSKAESDASSSQYTDNAINDHSNADDPHRDRASAARRRICRTESDYRYWNLRYHEDHAPGIFDTWKRYIHHNHRNKLPSRRPS